MRSILEKLLDQEVSQVAAMKIDWSDKHFLDSLFFNNLTLNIKSKIPEILPQLISMSVKERKEYLLSHVLFQIIKVLGLNYSKNIPLDCPFFDLGIDSLTSIELRNQLQTAFNVPLPSTLVFDYSTVTQLVDYLNEKLCPFKEEKDILPDRSANAKIEILQGLSDEEAESLLLDELNNLQF
jgi:acyl carrier protein